MIYKTIMIKMVIIARVSRSIQEYERQVNDLAALANANGWSIKSTGIRSKIQQRERSF